MSNSVPRCVSIDLEVSTEGHRIHRFAAVRGETGEAFTHRTGDLLQALQKLDAFAEGATFLLGHNLIAFDAPHLEAVMPDLKLLKLPRVDTLRLNPLAFPRNPYHHLVKHYQDGQLKRGRINDPELDARLALDVLADQQRALCETAADLLLAWHWLVGVDGFDSIFATIRGRARPTQEEARAAIGSRLHGQACRGQAAGALEVAPSSGWPLAYALAWLSVAGGNSVMPPWVRYQFPEAEAWVRRLRDTPCADAACEWCRQRHDARKELKRWFGWDTYRPEPTTEEGGSMQEAIVDAAMRGEPVLGILPTGTGKSVCYQIPALSRYEKTGALTVVISPLVALMADQVAGLQARGISSCAAVNGMLSMPERADVLDRVRLGDIAILLLAPEQLRSRAVRKALEQREIGAWVLDEAHCLSKWGHAFRPDYRYVGRFVREKARAGLVPPVLCLTATAKPDVVEDITRYFRKELGMELRVFDGGSTRANLDFAVVRTSPAEKYAHIHLLLEQHLAADTPGGAIVYCSTQKGAEDVASFLKAKQERAEHFHAALPPERKKSVQERFIRGEIRVIAATNAFGMGIDKPDVRLVVHADVPGSLENYLQEAGRAGRDRVAAHCVLLYTPEDVERQFGMSARSRLTVREIQAILRALRRVDRRKRLDGVVVATAGEILAEEDEGRFERDSATDDTRVRTAVAWLEEALLLAREDNVVNVFPSSLQVTSIDEAREKLEKRVAVPVYRNQLLRIVEALIAANPDEGISTDELMGVSALKPDQVRKALFDLADVGIARNDTALTAFVHHAVEHSSVNRLARAAALELALLGELRLAAPELGKGESSVLHLRHASHRLKEAGHKDALPERLWRTLRGLAADGRSDEGGIGSLRLIRIDSDTVQVALQREWSAVAKTAELRRATGAQLLEHLLSCLPAGVRGTDLLAATTLGRLREALEADALLAAQLKDPVKALERGLLWLHEQEVIRLNKGLAVFRSAMTIRLSPEKRGFGRVEFEPLKLHYDEQIVQIHVMAEYVERGLQNIVDALRLTVDYFTLKREDFIRRWLPQREDELKRQTTPASWRSIVEALDNPMQQRIVTEKEGENLLVLAGPGSGKTRVLVHRIAYLVRVLRENPTGILALAYNRHAAIEIRRRLVELIGNDAKGVMVRTCHGLAMRLAGLSFAGQVGKVDEEALRTVIPQAVAVLKGTGLGADDADEQRDRLLGGFRHILVDEYQDIGADQYDLISALAGRTLEDAERKLSLFAVGDDDQNIYAFAGASVEYIRRFQADYASRPVFITENYRSTQNIVAAANAIIEPARERMKADHPIAVNRGRAKSPPGGEWQHRDPVGEGKVQILSAGASPASQTLAVMAELERLSKLDPDWSWARVAVIAREWKYLEPVRAYCEVHGIPAQMAGDAPSGIWRLRETQALLAWVRAKSLVAASALMQQLSLMPNNEWVAMLQEAANEYALETGGAELPREYFIEWLAEWAREARRRQFGLLLLTAHRAKGLQFDHVAVLDGGWNQVGRGEDLDASRRLYYVAMTRARHTLCLARLDAGNKMLDALSKTAAILWRPEVALPHSPLLLRRYERMRLADVDLGFAGRSEKDAPIHRAIAELGAGSLLNLTFDGERRLLKDSRGMVVGRLATSYAPPKGMACIAARVAAIVSWSRADSNPEYHSQYRCDSWETVIPEFVFEPVALH